MGCGVRLADIVLSSAWPQCLLNSCGTLRGKRCDLNHKMAVTATLCVPLVGFRLCQIVLIQRSGYIGCHISRDSITRAARGAEYRLTHATSPIAASIAREIGRA